MPRADCGHLEAVGRGLGPRTRTTRQNSTELEEGRRARPSSTAANQPKRDIRAPRPNAAALDSKSPSAWARRRRADEQRRSDVLQNSTVAARLADELRNSALFCSYMLRPASRSAPRAGCRSPSTGRHGNDARTQARTRRWRCGAAPNGYANGNRRNGANGGLPVARANASFARHDRFPKASEIFFHVLAASSSSSSSSADHG